METDYDRKGPYGYARLHDPSLNKGTSFSAEERERYHLRGLLPARISTPEMQEMRVLRSLRRKTDDIERYIYLQSLQNRNEHLFYRLVTHHIEEIMPLIYTPTVGQACLEFGHIFRLPRGFYITQEDRGQIRAILDNWPERDVRMIVVTDGERILGLGDLGANGMGIPIGKLALYTACAGIPPQQCLPVMLDVGTNNEQLRKDPLYLGVDRPRLTGADFLALVDEFVDAVQDAYPCALIQFEDFLTPNAWALLRRYRERFLCFNDDIQGTAAVVLAGILAAGRITGVDFADLRILFLGAGSAATGSADLMTTAFRDAGLDADTARRRLWFAGRSGLIVQAQSGLAPHIRPYARDGQSMDLETTIRTVRPHVLIGATGSAGSFTEPVVRAMAAVNERPVIFALSNPTSRAECTAQQAYAWSDGRAVFASGSPFDPVELGGRTFRPGQGNNAYIFPGIGLGALVSHARQLDDALFLAAAHTLAVQVTQADLEAGSVYPKLSGIRAASLAIATVVAEQAWNTGNARNPRPADIEATVREYRYEP